MTPPPLPGNASPKRPRQPLGLGVGGQTGVENVLDIFRNGIDSALMVLGKEKVTDLGRTTSSSRTGPSAGSASDGAAGASASRR